MKKPLNPISVKAQKGIVLENLSALQDSIKRIRAMVNKGKSPHEIRKKANEVRIGLIYDMDYLMRYLNAVMEQEDGL